MATAVWALGIAWGWGQAVITAAPPQLVFVTNAHAMALLKHPTLPVLYATCHGAPESKNLVTYRLRADGSLIAHSNQEWPDYLSVDAKNPDYTYRLYRPTIDPENGILYLGIWPFDPTKYYANPNNHELAAVALDSQGQPAKLIKAFRTDHTTTEFLADIRFEPTLHRLYLSYWSYFGWCEMGRDGLPTTGKFNLIPYVSVIWYMWKFVPDWQRFYAFRADPTLYIFRLSADGLGTDFFQTAGTCTGSSGMIELSPSRRKLYGLQTPPSQSLVVSSLTAEGRLTSVPRTLPMPGVIGIRCDFRAGKLYGWTAELLWKTYAVDAEGYPKGEPQTVFLNCGAIRDVLVDEAAGKVYVLCPQQPELAKP